MAERHNGYKNYETWCVNLWLGNEESSQRYWQATAAECVEHARDNEHRSWSPKEHAKFRLADMLKEHMENAMPDVEGMWADMLRSALSEVDWHEVADAFLEGEDEYDELPETY